MEPMPGPESLQGRFVHLVPMGEDHIDGLVEAANEDRSTFTYTPVPWDRATMAAYVHKALAKRESGEQYPFVTFRVDQRRIVGSTRFYDLAPWDWSSLYPGSDVHQRDRPARCGRHRLHLAEPVRPAHAHQHRGQAADDDPRLRPLGRPGGADPDRRPQRPLTGSHRAARLSCSTA